MSLTASVREEERDEDCVMVLEGEEEEEEEGEVMERPRLTSKRWLLDFEDEEYDSEKEGSRPVQPNWPKDSLLRRDQFTIDEQQCLKCRKLLGYAMPMNKEPNAKYLFCVEEDGTEKCRSESQYLNCFACGNYHSSATATVVCRPGNSGYEGPSSIYNFMCYSCHKDMMENEPGVEECKRNMAAIREKRREDELCGGRGGGGGLGTMTHAFGGHGARAAGAMSASELFRSQLGERGVSGPVKRKRAVEKEEDDADTVVHIVE